MKETPREKRQTKVGRRSGGWWQQQQRLRVAARGLHVELPVVPVPSLSRRRDGHSAAPPSTFSRCINSDGERASAKWQPRQRLAQPARTRSASRRWPRRRPPPSRWSRTCAGSRLAVDETVILLHPRLPSVGVSIVMERERQQIESPVSGYSRPARGSPSGTRTVDRTRVSLQLQHGLSIGIAAVSRDSPARGTC